MATLLISTLLGIRLGVEDLFIREAEGAIKTTSPGRPSVGTMINFILIATAGILTMLNLTRLKVHFLRIGWVVSIIGAVAVAGYIIKMPILYYAVENFSTAMALHTSILFLLLGTGLILLGKKQR